MTVFFAAILAFFLFFVVFFGATKLLGHISRKRKGPGDSPENEGGF